MSRLLPWTTKTPTEPGYYFVRKFGEKPYIASLEEDGGILWNVTGIQPETLQELKGKAEFQGPLEPDEINALPKGSLGLWGLRDERWHLLDSTGGDDARDFLDGILYHTRGVYWHRGYTDFQITDENPGILWLPEDRVAAGKQGWGIFPMGTENPSLKIREISAQRKFTSADEAAAFVLAHAKEELHCRKAIWLVYGF